MNELINTLTQKYSQKDNKGFNQRRKDPFDAPGHRYNKPHKFNYKTEYKKYSCRIAQI